MAPARLILAASVDQLIVPTWLFLFVPVVGALVAGGLALYRLGHARGRRSAASTEQGHAEHPQRYQREQPGRSREPPAPPSLDFESEPADQPPCDRGRPLIRRDPSTLTAQDIMEAAGIARRTVTVWVELGLLPAPRRVPIGSYFANFFPHWTISRARFIRGKREAGFTYEQVRAMLDRDDDPPPRGGSAVGVA
jgi:hypothetical protein